MQEMKSDLITLKRMVDDRLLFNVPIYQRLYVWNVEQVKILMEDIEAAYTEDKALFYLGGVLVVKNEALSSEEEKVYDLIDGQQRFTTLWMIAIIFGGELTPFIEWKGNNRINFAIRDKINNAFRKLIVEKDEDDRFTSHMKDALQEIRHFKSQFERDTPGKAAAIAAFIFEKVQLVFTEVPAQTDLNKLFEVINNRGVQLQHHEILKSRLLDKLPARDRLKYSQLWDACAVMDQYIERNIRNITDIDTHALFAKEAAAKGEERLADPKIVLSKMEKQEDRKDGSISLLHILQSDEHALPKEREEAETADDEAEKVRSIVTFPMLLQHTLRIYLAKNNLDDIPKIADNALLDIFSAYFLTHVTSDEEIKSFIELLWKVRYVFDKHVIKWVGPKDHEMHMIRKIEKVRNKNYYYVQRGEATAKGEALLQSMLYHSQQITTHYWLTPYLKFLVDYHGQNSYAYLKHLDNHLFCGEKDDAPLIVRTRWFLEDPYYETTLSTAILQEHLGTEFPHYWFYKLEYILWEKYHERKGEKWKEFKLTAKNSVEHISPQTQRETDLNTVSKDMLNSFGNLALVSRSINSEYSNLPFNEKRQRFINNNREELDSLKMELIYENETWNDQQAKAHQEKMIALVDAYLGLGV